MTGSPVKKRIRRTPEVTRNLILEAASRIMVDEGYAAVTARRVAKEIGVNSALIHYYYPTLDDLFDAVHEQFMDRHIDILKTALDHEDPLRELWRSQTDAPLAALGAEILSVANHRKNIAPLIAERAMARKAEQADLLESRAIVRNCIPGLEKPVGITQVLLALARVVVNERAIGINSGHADIGRFVDWLITQLTHDFEQEGCTDAAVPLAKTSSSPM